jgi:hypothetical protein
MVKRTRKIAKEVEEDFPHFVDIAVPPGGLGSKLAAMYDFHARHRISLSVVTVGSMKRVGLCAGALCPIDVPLR